MKLLSPISKFPRSMSFWIDDNKGTLHKSTEQRVLTSAIFIESHEWMRSVFLTKVFQQESSFSPSVIQPLRCVTPLCLSVELVVEGTNKCIRWSLHFRSTQSCPNQWTTTNGRKSKCPTTKMTLTRTSTRRVCSVGDIRRALNDEDNVSKINRSTTRNVRSASRRSTLPFSLPISF